MNPIAEEILSYLGVSDDESLEHYGVKRRSGRYPWGSGEDPFQHAPDFYNRVREYEKQGLITGLAMHPLYVGTIFKKVNTAYFGFSGNDPDGLCDASSPVGFASAEGTLSEDSVSSF